MPYRNLTDDEVTLAQSIFGNSIQYEDVKIYDEPWEPPWPLSLILFGKTPVDDRAHAPDGNIYYPPDARDYGVDNFATADLNARATFIHEMAHVWQHQKGVRVPFYVRCS